MQREAARRRLQQVGVGLRKTLPGHRLSEMRRVGGLQRAEGDLGEQSGGPHPDDPAREFSVLVEGVLAHRRGHQELRVIGQPQAERDERQRLLITPLHVVQHQQQRAVDGQQRPRQALEEAVTLPGICRRSRLGPAVSVSPGGDEPADFGAPGGVEGRHR